MLLHLICASVCCKTEMKLVRISENERDRERKRERERQLQTPHRQHVLCVSLFVGVEVCVRVYVCDSPFINTNGDSRPNMR